MKKFVFALLLLWTTNVLVGQNCQIVFVSPNSHTFPASGGTIDISVQYSTTQCEEAISNKPSWITTATFLNRNTLRLVAASNPGGVRSGSVLITVNSGNSSTVSVSQATSAVPPGTPSVTGDSRCGPGSVTLSASPGSGGNAIRWYENSSGGSPIGTSTSLTTSINATRNYYAASYNTTTQLYSSRVAVLAQVTSPPTPFLGSAPSGCSGDTATGSAQSLSSDGVTSHIWYTASSGGSVVSGVAQNTAPGSGYYISSLTRTITATTTYYVAAVCNGLESSTRRAVTFTLDNAPQITIGVSGGAQTSYCPGETVTLLAQGGSSYQWRRGSATGTVLSTSTSFGVTASDTYYLTGTRSCGSTQTKSIVISFEAPATPSQPTITNNCGNTVLTKTSAPSGFTYYWQNTAGGTDTSAAASAPSITRTSGSVYYLRARNNSTECWGPARTVNYSVNAAPAAPTNVNGDSRCGSGSVTVSATPGSGGNTIRWYTSSSGGSLLDTGSSLTRTISQTTTYYAESYNSTTQCASSSRVAVTASVTAPPIPDQVAGSGCSGESGVISARSPDVDNVTEHRWYTAASGGSQVTAGVTQNTAPGSGNYISTLSKVFTSTETYYVASVCNGVESTTRRAVTYTVTSAANITIGVSGGAQPQYCTNTVTLLAQGGSNYEWRQGSATGSIIGSGTTLDVTTSGEYFLTGTRDCGSAQSTSIEITFANLTTPTIQSIVENCGQTIITMDSAPNGEVWHWQSSADGTEQTAGSTDQTRTFTADEPLFLRSRAEFTDCWGPAIEVDLQVKLVPNAPAANDYTQCGNDPFDLFATMDPNADTIYWYDVPTGGTPLDEGTSYRVNTVVNGTTSYYVESYNSVTECTSATRTEIQATVLAGERPTAPTGPTVYFCEEGTVTLTVTQPSTVDEIRWYDVQTGPGTVLGTGTTFTTPIINETTTYYVEGVNTTYGCTSNHRRAIFAVRSQEIVWYLDEDQDGLGDPANPSAPSCSQPQGYVGNNNDLCPEIYSPSNSCSSDPLDQNYVYTRVYQERSTTTIDQGFFTENDNLIQEITYFDGLGRALQQIAIDQSPQKNDIVTLMEYDGIGRMNREWLPYPTTDGNLATLRLSPKSGTLAYYNQAKYEDTQNPFLEKGFEISPLNRVKQQAAPGNDWALGQGHEIDFDYETNTLADAIKQLSVNTNVVTENGVITYETTLVEGTEYPDGELIKAVTYDENHSPGSKNHSTEEFTDKEGNMVLKRTYADVDGSSEVAHDTYYVYDDFGNLSFVLPPKIDVTNGVSPVELNELGYQYTYDRRNRLVVKKLPGKGEEYIIYNSLDQPIVTQDANQRLQNEWLFTKYDAFGRAAITGKMERALNRTQIQNEVNTSPNELWVTQYTSNSTTSHGGATYYYNNNGYPNSGITEILTINYYDAYKDMPSGAPSSVTLLGSIPSETSATNVQGLPTVSRVRVLDVTPAQWINTVSYYDDKGRVIYTYSENEYLGTVDQVESQLDFVGRPLKVRTTHTRSGNTIVTIDNFTYDHVGRLLSQTQCIGDETLGTSCSTNGGSAPVDLIIENETVTTDRVATLSITTRPVTTISGTVTLQVDPNATGGGTSTGTELIVFNAYDELGQLEDKKVGGTPENSYATTTGLQEVDYEYNVRGWLTDINNVNNLTQAAGPDDLFAFRIRYNDPQNFGGNENPAALFNGNISQTFWNTASVNTTANPVSTRYSYNYDGMNRITAAFDNTDHYSVPLVEYDKNGNIERLARRGAINIGATSFNAMDDLTYNYDAGNKLLKIDEISTKSFGFASSYTGTANQYDYDDNGNLTMDLNKNISLDGIAYNHLNLPTGININGGTISYVYDATGMKLEKEANDAGSTTTTSYAGNYIYENSTLRLFSHPEGYVEPDGNGGYDYIYSYLDHLGNVRLSYSDLDENGSIDASTEILQERNFYPFGLEHRGYNNVVVGTESKYKTFQSQEKHDELGLNWLSFKYRFYDPATARFFNVDPLAEDYVYNGVYNFAENRVIDGVELEGLEWKSVKDEDGNITLQLTVQLYNDAGLSDKELTKLKESITEQFAESFSNEDENITAELVIEDTAKAEGDFLVTLNSQTSTPVKDKDGKVVAKKFRGGKAGALGKTQKNDFEVTAKKDGTKRSNSDIARSFSHEAGHTAGLRHPWSKKQDIADAKQGGEGVTAKTIRKNLMNTGANPVKANRSSSGTTLTKGQLKSVDKLIRSQQ
ncbi:MAG: DUF6443 domain-containing protein [Flavobacteriaceae bacterium]